MGETKKVYSTQAFHEGMKKGKTEAIVLSPEQYKEDMVKFVKFLRTKFSEEYDDDGFIGYRPVQYENKLYTIEEVFDIYSTPKDKSL